MLEKKKGERKTIPPSKVTAWNGDSTTLTKHS